MTACPVCASPSLDVFFEQVGVPVHCNVLAATEAEARGTPRGDVRLGHCDACGMIHNAAFDPGLLQYGADYENSLHFSPRFNAYAQELARRLVDTYGLRTSRVVEVGCGKGDFLAMLAEGGQNSCLGFDSSYEGGQDHVGVRVERTFFDAAIAAEQPADLVVSRHVLEHVEQPAAFIDQLVGPLAEGGVLYTEVPDAMYTLRDLGIWDIIYEHCSYFTAPTLARLLESRGLAVVDVRSTFGGQFLSADARRSGAGIAPPSPTVAEVADAVASFGRAFTDKVAGWNSDLAERFGRGERLAVWGAGSKGVTFLNTVERGAEVQAVVDINERKHGRFIPGSGQRVVGPRDLVADGVDAVLVMNPNYLEEIRGQLAELGLEPAVLAV